MATRALRQYERVMVTAGFVVLLLLNLALTVLFLSDPEPGYIPAALAEATVLLACNWLMVRQIQRQGRLYSRYGEFRTPWRRPVPYVVLLSGLVAVINVILLLGAN